MMKIIMKKKSIENFDIEIIILIGKVNYKNSINYIHTFRYNQNNRYKNKTFR